MNESLLNDIKKERRLNLGKRFNIWIEAQWGYEGGSFNKWRVSEERAIREIVESILLDPTNEYFSDAKSTKYYFTYKDNKLISSNDDILFGNTIHIDKLIFKELLRDCRLNEIIG